MGAPKVADYCSGAWPDFTPPLTSQRASPKIAPLD